MVDYGIHLYIYIERERERESIYTRVVHLVPLSLRLPV